MAEEILITPEITMHEEPGEIRFNRGEMAVEMDDIPADVSITRVNKTTLAAPKPFLKIRSDLTRMPMQQAQVQQHHQPRLGPPPLQRAPIPPMPRLKLGANPLTSMYNMLPSQRHFHPPHMAFAHPPRMRPPAPAPPQPRMKPPVPIGQAPPLPIPPPAGLNGSLVRNSLPGGSLLRPRQPPPKRTKPPVPGHHHPVPQEPLPISAGRGSKRPGPRMVQVPPPLSGKDMASKVIQNGGVYTLSDLNITVTSVPRKQAVAGSRASDIVTVPVSAIVILVGCGYFSFYICVILF